ncbi:hypothetical protein JX265_005891 [Neoarthrinium moseri]|uniref:Uncharacterized protein n=1 Tax=Neoarthrinium moseri TaxID=1658444 RepID=A0A9Q0AQC4_9PEZI|nr:uncharacterized protein JN550_002139 [Neoarthrinium moseri]KAI1848112.1 hypothetical protein JX266_005825 [Neoarthrinium moseri]KAI1871905.1 hypothetical protein JX265_005891 [Neoarthrinium moseri]KAI1875853.1 hypothetical protein JN550_002139 [Neoarthrinium moseri]
MHFTTSFVTLVALAGVYALPGSGIEARQAQPRILTIGWFTNSQCSGAPAGQTTVTQAPSQCVAISEPAQATNLRVLFSNATAIARIFNTEACDASAPGEQSFDIIPGVDQGCSAFSGAKSLKWAPF